MTKVETYMKPLHDWRCGRCDSTFEERGGQDYHPQCPRCGSGDTTLVFLASPRIKGPDKDPYDALDRVIPDSRPIKSFANDKRRGGKDTTGAI